MVQNIRSFSLNVSVVVWHTWTHACCLFDVLYCQAFSVELWPSWFCLCVQGWSDPDETVQSDQRRSALLLPCPLLPLPLLSLSPSGLVLTTCDGAPPRLAIDAEPCSQAPGRRRRDRGEEGDGRGRHHLRNFCVSRESGCQLQDQQDALWSVSDFQVNSSGFFVQKVNTEKKVEPFRSLSAGRLYWTVLSSYSCRENHRTTGAGESQTLSSHETFFYQMPQSGTTPTMIELLLWGFVSVVAQRVWRVWFRLVTIAT